MKLGGGLRSRPLPSGIAMKIQILWVEPAEKRFVSGDVLTGEQLASFDIDADELLASGDAQLVDPLDHDGNGRKGGSKPRKARA